MLKNIFEPNVKQNQEEAAQVETAAKQAAKAEEESQLAQKAAEESAAEEKLRESISDIDAKILQFQSLLEAMQNSNDAASTAVGSATERKKTLETKFKDLETQFKDLLANPEYRQVLEAQGLHSVNDLLANEQYNQEEDVVNFQRTKQEKSEQYEETRTKIQERREIKNQAIEAVSQETGEPVKKMNQQETIQAVKNLVEVLEKNRKELFDQTPEGKEAIKQEVLENIQKAFEYDITMIRVKNYFPSKLKDLIKDHGEELVKEQMQEYFKQNIDTAFDEGKESNLNLRSVYKGQESKSSREFIREQAKNESLLKMEMNWSAEMLKLFRDKNQIDSIESGYKRQEDSKLFLANFNVIISGLDGQLKIDKYGALSFADTDPYEVMDLKNKIDAKQKEIIKKQKEIADIDEQAQNAGMDLLGTKKRKREEEKSKLQESLFDLSTELESMTIEYDAKNTRNQELDKLRKSMGDINIKLTPGEFTPQELQTMISEQMNFSLTEEQTELLKKDKELERQAVLAENSYTTKV